MSEARPRWAAWLRIGLQMGLAPQEFWRMSIREWRWLTETSSPQLDRTELGALMAQFPDEHE